MEERLEHWKEICAFSCEGERKERREGGSEGEGGKLVKGRREDQKGRGEGKLWREGGVGAFVCTCAQCVYGKRKIR